MSQPGTSTNTAGVTSCVTFSGYSSASSTQGICFRLSITA
nr:MAG TPA_asm: hypothetical protein [Bacteriophage sp.]